MIILIIDDDPVVRHILSAVINGYASQYLPAGETTVDLKVATSGTEGLEVLGSLISAGTPPAVFFLDLQLMDMTGMELLDQVCKTYGESVPPVIPMSARPQIELEVKHPEKNWSLFLQKPFVPDQVIAQIRTALGN